MYRDIDLRLTAEHRALREGVHQFAARLLRPVAAVLDRVAEPADVTAERSPFWRAFREAYRLGYHRFAIARDLGGLGLDALGQHVLLEELGWGAADLALGLVAAGFPAVASAQTGNPALVDQFVRPFAEDAEARVIGCWAVTEPAHGSDALMVGTPQFHDPRAAGELIARRDRDAYVLRGEKAAWVSNGTIATHALTFFTLDPAQGMAGGGVAVVPLHLRGVSRGRPLDKMGQRALSQAALVFDDVRIPDTHLLTDTTLYEFVLDRTLAFANACMAAIATGVARAAYEEALAYSRERVQGGRPLCEHQLVQHRLFEMFARVEACRALSRAAMIDHHATLPPATEYAIAAKTFCTAGALEVAGAALQLLGGQGLSREHPVEKLFRDARTLLIAHGSNDVLALVGARRLLQAAAHGGRATPGSA